MLEPISLLFLAACLFVLYLTALAAYNVLFHPLRKYPGPLLNKTTEMVRYYYTWHGFEVQYVTMLHEKYGEVVRVSPNELSYTTASAWQDIFAHRSAGGNNLPKCAHNRRPDPTARESLIWANDENHRRMRRLQSHAFSDKALKEQEPLLKSYVDKLISKLRERCFVEVGTLNLVQWYNYTTFDLMGDLAFGDSFGCLDKDYLHPWITIIFASVKNAAYLRVARGFPSPIRKLLQKLQPPGMSGQRREHLAFASSKARERLNRGGTDRVDIMSYLLKHNDEKGMTLKELESNAGLLVLAGSETTATFLSGITYNLLKTPLVLDKLTKLVRTTFPSERDITINSVQQLEYFTACLEEGFRTYPPVPIGLARRTTEEGNIISGRFVPPGTSVYVSQWAAYRSESNFAEPKSFVPERWLKNPPSKYANDHLDVVQPFSVGPRNCLGRSLAYAEMRLILARMLWNFDMELSPQSLQWNDPEQKVYFLWEKVPLEIKLTPRNV